MSQRSLPTRRFASAPLFRGSASGGPPTGGQAEPPAVPRFLVAEVAVKSRRSDYRSLLDPDAAGGDLKRCRADATTLKDAVAALKRHGFSITHIGPCTLTIVGSRGSFEATFGVELSAETTDDSQLRIRARPASATATSLAASSLIHPLSGVLAPYLASLLFPPPTRLANGETPPPKTDATCDIYLDEVRRLLGGFQQEPTGKDVRVVVADSGIYSDHPWIKSRLTTGRYTYCKTKGSYVGINVKEVRFARAVDKLRDDAINPLIQNAAAYAPPMSDAMRQDLTAFFKNVRFQADLQTLIDTSPSDTSDLLPLDIRKSPDLSAALADLIPTLEKCRHCLTTIACHDTYAFGKSSLTRLKDTYHGTSVLANVLAVAPESHLKFQDCESHGGPFRDRVWESTREVLNDKSDTQLRTIINCSWSTDEQLSDANANNASKKLWQELLDRAQRQQTLLVVIAGNKGRGPSLEASVLHEASLIVGGAYFDKTTPPETLTASNLASAYPADSATGRRAIPDVCGLVAGEPAGQRRRGLIYCPQDLADWEAKAGTSFAAPQVAAVCALIRQTWKQAPLAAIKDIVRHTSQLITLGQAYQPFTQSDFWWGAADCSVGLVQIDRALALARFFMTVDLTKLPWAEALQKLLQAASPTSPTSPATNLVLDCGRKSISLIAAKTALLGIT